MGITLPRRYGGLNFPVTVSVMIVEMISRADPALMNVFGLQDIAETVNKFAADELKDAYLPRFASGEVTGSMALTEPEAGSDLQNVQLKASLGDDGVWRLNGVKRFITNGGGQVSLVLARSEEGTSDARGPVDVPLRARRAHDDPPPRRQSSASTARRRPASCMFRRRAGASLVASVGAASPPIVILTRPIKPHRRGRRQGIAEGHGEAMASRHRSTTDERVQLRRTNPTIGLTGPCKLPPCWPT